MDKSLEYILQIHYKPIGEIEPEVYDTDFKLIELGQIHNIPNTRNIVMPRDVKNENDKRKIEEEIKDPNSLAGSHYPSGTAVFGPVDFETLGKLMNSAMGVLKIRSFSFVCGDDSYFDYFLSRLKEDNLPLSY